MRWLALSLVLAACPAKSPPSPPGTRLVFETFAELSAGPGNIAVTSDGRVFVSMHQFYEPAFPVAEVKGNELVPFAAGAELSSVLGIRSDSRGVIWMLDNGMRGGTTRKLVAWNATLDKLVTSIDLTEVSPADAFLNDFTLDRNNEVAYIADPAGGKNAAIIVVDLVAGTARRVLEGHRSVIPEDIDLVIDGKIIGKTRVGINPIALDDQDEWLYFGPMHGTTLYRVATRDLRDPELDPGLLSGRIQPYAKRPITDGISIDEANNIYLGDLANNAIGVIDAGRNYRIVQRSPTMSWIDAFSFGPDGFFYVVANQLHRSAVLNGGVAATKPPFLVLRFRPYFRGRVGR
jgi:sugar lactone lactonase YvrE